jgi:hypothetical protein
MKKRTVQVAILVMSVSLLAGCTSSAPVEKPTRSTPSSSQSAKPVPSQAPTTGAATPSAEPSTGPSAQPAPAPTPAPVKTTVVEIGADELRIEDLSGNVKNAFPYKGSSPSEAITTLTSLYGKEPTKRYTGDQTCDYQMNVYTWDNLTMRFQAESQNPNDADYFIINTNSANQNYERVVQAPNGAQIGQSLDKLHKAFPELAYSAGDEYEGVTYSAMIGEPSKLGTETAGDYDVANITPAGANTLGVVVYANNDKIQSILAPAGLIGDC